MTAISRSTAKEFFGRSDEPTQDQFWALLDSLLFKTESGDLALVGLKEYYPAADYVTGMTCIYNKAVYQANTETGGTWDPDAWDLIVSGIGFLKTEIAHEEILALGDSSVEVLPAQGIDLAPHFFFFSLQFVGDTAYTVNTVLDFKFENGNTIIARSIAILKSEANRIVMAVIQGSGAAAGTTDQEIVLNDAVVCYCSGNPEGGAAGQKIVVRAFYFLHDYSDEEDEGSGSGSAS